MAHVTVRVGVAVAGVAVAFAAYRGATLASQRPDEGPAATATATASASAVSATGSTAPASDQGRSSAAAIPGAVVVTAPADVLPAVGTAAPVPTLAGLTAALSGVLENPALGGTMSFDVVDALGGDSLVDLTANVPREPASTAKLLTAAAALSLRGPDATLPTRVLQGATVNEIVLVGGGDVLLSAGAGDPSAVNGHAGLADLADATARALKGQGRATVALRLDDRLFTGPATAPTWSAFDISSGYVAPVMALEVDAGRAARGKYAGRLTDPAMSAARTFAALLGERGVAVTGAVARAAAPQGAPALAEVRSAALGDLVEYTLTESDNTVAEALARLVAVAAGRPATFTDAGVAVVDQVNLLGAPTDGARLVGGSGLGAGNAVTARTLTAVLALAASSEHPELRSLLTGLPVAGVSGTLSDRFVDADTSGAGVVRAKTGTLSNVSALAGTVVDADGRMLVFAVLADSIPATSPARKALDAIAVTLAGCGCR